jgi:hypothetical protein
MYAKLRVTLLASIVALGAAGIASAATLKGAIAKVDPSARTLTVKDGQREVPLSLAGDAKVLDGQKAISLSTLKVGDEVRVVYADKEGKHLASRVEMARAGQAAAHPAKPAKKAY